MNIPVVLRLYLCMAFAAALCIRDAHAQPSSGARSRPELHGVAAASLGDDSTNVPHAAIDISRHVIVKTLVSGTVDTATLLIEDIGDAELDVMPSVPQDAQSWLKVEGELRDSSTLPQLLPLRCDATNLEPGTYKTILTLDDNDISMPRVRIPVYLFVIPAPLPTQPAPLVLERANAIWEVDAPMCNDTARALRREYGPRLIELNYLDDDTSGTSIQAKWFDLADVEFIPSGVLNRSLSTTEPGFTEPCKDWRPALQRAAAAPESPYNLALDSISYDPVTQGVHFTMTLLLADAELHDRRLAMTAVIIEDSVNLPQWAWAADTSQHEGSTPMLYPYYHDRVVRDIYPDVYGMPLEPAAEDVEDSIILKPGTMISRGIDFTIDPTLVITGLLADSTPPPAFHAERARLVVLLHMMVDDSIYGPILQAVEAPLPVRSSGIGTPAAREQPLALRCYPNPATNELRLEYSLPHAASRQVAVYNAAGVCVLTEAAAMEAAGAHGLLLDVARLASGNYLVVVTAGEVKCTREVVIIH